MIEALLDTDGNLVLCKKFVHFRSEVTLFTLTKYLNTVKFTHLSLRDDSFNDYENIQLHPYDFSIVGNNVIQHNNEDISKKNIKFYELFLKKLEILKHIQSIINSARIRCYSYDYFLMSDIAERVVIDSARAFVNEPYAPHNFIFYDSTLTIDNNLCKAKELIFDYEDKLDLIVQTEKFRHFYEEKVKSATTIEELNEINSSIINHIIGNIRI